MYRSSCTVYYADPEDNVDAVKQDKGKCKGKFHPTTGHEGPAVEYKYSSTLSLTSALDGGGWSTPRPGRFTPVKRPGTHCTGGLAPGPVWTGAENIFVEQISASPKTNDKLWK